MFRVIALGFKTFDRCDLRLLRILAFIRDSRQFQIHSQRVKVYGAD